MTACSVAAPSTTTSPFAAASSRSLAAACTGTGTHIFAGTPTPVKVNTACIIIAHCQLCGSSMRRGSQLTFLGSTPGQSAGCHAQGAVDCCSMQQHWPPVAAVQQKLGSLLLLETNGWLSPLWPQCLPKTARGPSNQDLHLLCASAWQTNPADCDAFTSFTCAAREGACSAAPAAADCAC